MASGDLFKASLVGLVQNQSTLGSGHDSGGLMSNGTSFNHSLTLSSKRLRVAHPRINRFRAYRANIAQTRCESRHGDGVVGSSTYPIAKCELRLASYW